MRNPFARKKTRQDLPLLVGAGVGAALGAAVLRLQDRRNQLEDKVALIAGGSRGLGFELARQFARQGCRIAICARNSGELDTARAMLEREGTTVLALPCDLGDRDQVQRMVSMVRSRFGQIDILCNVAGVIQVGPIETMTVEDFEEAMRVMFWGALYPTLEVLHEMMRRKDGRIVNITSIGGKVAVPHLVPYGCAKFAAVALSEGLRAELRRHGVKVITIVPGLMRTGSFMHAFFKGQPEREFEWFAAGAATPGFAMSARRAARQIVSATRRGQSERVLSVPAKALAAFHAMFPSLTADLLGLVNSLVLPSTEGGSAVRARGAEVSPRSLLGRVLARAGMFEGTKYNQAGAKAA